MQHRACTRRRSVEARPRVVAAWLVLSVFACGGDDAALGGGLGGMPIDEPPADDEACEAAGGVFGMLGEPLVLNDALGELESGSFSALGLLAHDDGLWATFDRGRTSSGRPTSYTVALDLDGRPLAPAVVNDAVWGGGRVWPGPDGAVVTYCRDQRPGVIFMDDRGTPLGDPIAMPTFVDCLRPPAVAWGHAGELRMTWIARGYMATDCATGSCIVSAVVERDGTVRAHSVSAAGDPGPGNSSSIAQGSDTALVVALAWTGQADHTAVLANHSEGVEPPEIYWLTPPSDGDDNRYSHARAVADEDDGFVVFVGGYGPSLGRMRVGPEGQLRSPLVELPVFHDVPTYSVYEGYAIEVAARPGGTLLYGRAWANTQPVGLLTAIDPRGEVRANVMLAGDEIAVASHAGRTWALHDRGGGTLQIVELGCVPAP